MPKAKPDASEIIEIVAGIRARNNGVWMGILEIALASEPTATRRAIQMINENDTEVTKWLKKL